MELRFERDLISSVRTSILSKDLVQDKERYCGLMRKLTKEFLEKQFYNGDELIEYAKEKNIKIGDSFIVFKHEKGTALINLLSFSVGREVEISAAINVMGDYFLSGFTFSRGHFSDVYLHCDTSYNDYIWFSTRDTLFEHNLYLCWVIERLEKEFYDSTVEVLNDDTFDFYMFDIRLFNALEKEIVEKIHENQSKRIDTLNIDGSSIKDYLFKHQIWKTLHSENDIYKICLLYGKPYKQVKKYIQKYGV